MLPVPTFRMRSVLLSRACMSVVTFLLILCVSLPAGGSELSVMSFNIRYGTANDGENRWENRREMVCDLIEKYDCDVVGLQEALRFQIDEIRQAIPEYAEIGVGRDDGQTKGEYSGILYRADRLSVTDSGTFWLSDTPEVIASTSWGNTITRICTWGRFVQKDSSKAFYHFNVHLDHRSQPSREKSVVLIDRRIAKRVHADPVVLTGDFNAGESNPAIRFVKGDAEADARPAVPLVDTFRVLHPGADEVGTFNSFKGERSGAKIDYVFAQPGVEVLEAKIIFDTPDGRCPSDHYPVMARLELASVTEAGNPIITHKYTADPAALVHDGTVYLYCGHDQAAPRRNGYDLREWLVFSSTDMVHWTEHPVPLKATDFGWAKGEAWAAQVIERNGKFYWYVTVEHKTITGKAIGVAVADSPIGPFKDARGSALITNDMTTDVSIRWDDIDPTVFVDDNGQAYLYWGNQSCRWVKLKENMTEFEGPIHYVTLPHFTEAPWIHQRGDWYYLSYGYQFPEKTAYAMSRSIEGPWEFKGILNEVAGNCNTNHQSIIEYKGKWYFIYHNGSIPTQGGSFRRSVCIDDLHYHPDGTMKRIVMTSEGVAPAK